GSHSLQIDNRGHVGVRSEAFDLFRNTISLSCQPWVPVRSLLPRFFVVQHDIRKPSFHGSPNQPAVAALAEILIFCDPNPKLHYTPLKGRHPNINAEGGPHPCEPVRSFTITVKVSDSHQPAIPRRLRVQRQIFPGCSVDHPASSRKVGTNCAIMPGC